MKAAVSIQSKLMRIGKRGELRVCTFMMLTVSILSGRVSGADATFYVGLKNPTSLATQFSVGKNTGTVLGARGSVLRSPPEVPKQKSPGHLKSTLRYERR